VPDPRLGIDRLAHRAQKAQRGEIAAVRILLAPAHEGADRGGSGVADRDAVTLDDAPEAVLVGEVGRAFVHHGGGAVGEGAVYHVGMPGDPADVGGARVDVRVLEVEHPVGGRENAGQVAAGGVL